jgi:hypothetical protein
LTGPWPQAESGRPGEYLTPDEVERMIAAVRHAGGPCYMPPSPETSKAQAWESR